MRKNYRVLKENLWKIDFKKDLPSEDYETITILCKNVELTIPINFFNEAGEGALKDSIPYSYIEAISYRCQQVYDIQAEFSGSEPQSRKVAILLKEGETGNSYMHRAPPTLFLHTPTPRKLLDLIAIDRDTGGDLISGLSHEMGHVFEFLGANVDPAYMKDFEEKWTNVLAVYTCEKLNVPSNTLNWGRLTSRNIENFRNTGSYALLTSPSDYGYSMLKEIKDFGGWDVFKKLFHELGKNPLREGITNEERWGAIRNIILEKSQVDIAPILHRYHVPLSKEIHTSFAVGLNAEGQEALVPRAHDINREETDFRSKRSSEVSHKAEDKESSSAKAKKYRDIWDLYNDIFTQKDSSDFDASERIPEVQRIVHSIDPNAPLFEADMRGVTADSVLNYLYPIMKKAYHNVVEAEEFSIKKENGELFQESHNAAENYLPNSHAAAREETDFRSKRSSEVLHKAENHESHSAKIKKYTEISKLYNDILTQKNISDFDAKDRIPEVEKMVRSIDPNAPLFEADMGDITPYSIRHYIYPTMEKAYYDVLEAQDRLLQEEAYLIDL